ncbi:MAG: hypothetical protein ACE5FS_01620 [Paracoccaceae bacterium]
MIRFLEAAGWHARHVLAAGCILAMFLPALSAFLRPFLPYLVSMVLALAMARIDLVAAARAAFRPRRLALLVGVSIALIPLAALGYGVIARVAGLGDAERTALVLLAAAPPIASSAGLCFLLGYNVRLAVEITVSATLLTPLLGPLTVALVLPGSVALSPWDLGIRLGGMVVLGAAAAVAIRMLAGHERIARRGRVFDGVAALAMLLFVIPLFDRVPQLVLAEPMTALRIFALAVVFNLGANLVVRQGMRSVLPAATANAVGLLHGNRAITLYLAALPFDPVFSMFVALYQFPMYFTPILFDRKGAPVP